MAGNKLNTLRKQINCYLGIPYWTNKLKGKKILIEGFWGGKGNYQQIHKATSKIASQKGILLSNLSKLDKYRLQKNHHIGIDCSGLTYHLLDFWYKINTNNTIYTKIIGTDNKTGPRRVNVKMLSHPKNSTKIKNLSNIKTGDIIVMNKKSHVLFIVNSNKKTINYVHNSNMTKKRGVHYGTINIKDPKKDLRYQLFSDITKNGQEYNRLIFPNRGDGIYRLNIFKNL